MLTKSLHTITAATNVACYLTQVHGTAHYRHGAGPQYLTADALSILGYKDAADSLAWGLDNDPTIQRIVANCAKLLNAPGAARAFNVNRTALLQRQAG